MIFPKSIPIFCLTWSKNCTCHKLQRSDFKFSQAASPMRSNAHKLSTNADKKKKKNWAREFLSNCIDIQLIHEEPFDFSTILQILDLFHFFFSNLLWSYKENTTEPNHQNHLPNYIALLKHINKLTPNRNNTQNDLTECPPWDKRTLSLLMQ